NSLAASGYLKKYQLNALGTAYTEIAAGTVTDLLQDVAPTGASGHNYFTFLLQNGAPINAFWGGGPSSTLPSGITSMPDLTGLTKAGDCGPGTFDFKPSTWGAVEHVNSAPGSDNGYARTSDGKCGAWQKTAKPGDHTPNVTNGSAAGIAGALTTAQTLTCNPPPLSGKSVVTYNISGVTGDAYIVADFPVHVLLYYDFGTIGQLDGADVAVGDKTLATTKPAAATTDTFHVDKKAQPVLLIYKTARGCFDKIVPLTNSCIPLPVKFKSFNAARNHSNVDLRWETAFEQNNSGFAVERNIRGAWEQVAFVPTQAANGNSESALTYQLTDLNNIKGMSQYRIRQVDFDAKSSYSEIRAVRGEGQTGKTVVYPNPSFDGRVSIVFEDATVTRDASLSDMSGRVLKQWKGITNNNIQLDNLTPGMYSLKIVVPETGEQSVEKIIVSKR
ncbi:MAG: T9SS type A sorting domain-containing protein, partial [Bacteroidetes bacterium]